MLQFKLQVGWLMNTQGFFYNTVAVLLRIALVMALVGAVWNIHRHLPDDLSDSTQSGANVGAETSLQIILREPSDESHVPVNLPVTLYPIDVQAARHEYLSDPRPGKRIEDFLAERMGNRSPIETHFDENGQVTLTIKSGPWWVRTMLPGEYNTEWLLRVNVSGKNQTVELTMGNYYTRSRSF